MGKSIIKKLLIAFMVAFILIGNVSNSLGQITVLADDNEENESEDSGKEEDEEESDDEEGGGKLDPSDLLSGKGNIYGMGTKDGAEEAKGVLEDASQYDIRMQFLITYAFLKDEYGEVNGNSTYHEYFYPKNASNNSVFDDLVTSPQEVIGNIAESEIDDIHDDGEVDEDDEQIDGKKLEEDFAKVLAKEHVNNIIKTYGISTKEVDKIWGNRHHSGEYMGYEIPNYTEGKNFYTKGSATEDAREHLEKEYAKLFASLLSNIGKGDLEKDGEPEFLTSQISGVFDVFDGDKSLVSILNDYRNVNVVIPRDVVAVGNKMEGIGIGGIEKTGGAKGNADFRDVGDEDFLKKLQYPAGTENWDNILENGIGIKIERKKQKGGEFSEEEMKRVFDVFPEYQVVSAMYNGKKHGFETSMSVDGFKKDFQKVRKKVELDIKRYQEDELNKFIAEDKEAKKLYEDFKKYKNEQKDYSVEGNERIITWAIISPYLKDIDTDDRKQLEEYMQEDDPSISVEEKKIYQKTGGEEKLRPIFMRDFHYASKKTGKVLIANGDDYVRYVIGNTEDTSEGISIGEYAGMAMKENNIISASLKRDGGDGEVDGTEAKSSYNVRLNKHIAAFNGKAKNGYNIKVKAQSDDILGIDSYGNIIDSTSGTILIPYWQNETVGEFSLEDRSVWASHSIYKNKKRSNADEIVEGLLNEIRENEYLADDQKIIDAFEDAGVTLDSVPGSIKEISKSTKGLSEALEDDEEIERIALAITAGTHKEVKKWNEKLLKSGKSGNELFVQLDSGQDNTAGGNDTEKDKREEYTNADLREKIGHMLDYGFFEVLRLTLASWIVSIYNSGFLYNSMTAVFHTTTLADLDIWGDIVSLFKPLVTMAVGLYLLIMTFRFFKGKMRFKQMVQQFLVVTVIILIPTVVYSPFINLVINKPTPMFLGNQMKQTMILDGDLHMKEKAREKNEDSAYEYLFHGDEEYRDKSQDYIVEFYTTTHKSGFDIEEIEDEESLDFMDRIKIRSAEKSGQWDRRDVETIGVSVYDLIDWVQEKVDEGETSETLFEWLAENREDNYEGIGNYKEVSYDPNMRNANLGFLEDKSIEVESIKASELFEMIYEASSSKADGGTNLQERIQNLTEVASVVSHKEDGEYLSRDEVDAIIRDFSLSHEGREVSFGTDPIDSEVVKKPKDDTPNVSQKTVSAWERISTEKLLIPENDYLNLETTMDELHPEIRDPRETDNEKIVYDVNRKVLSDYVNVQAMVRDTIGSDIWKGEFMSVTLNEFFEINKAIDIPLFPTKVEPDSISMDTFSRMIFIPIQEYRDNNDEDLGNLAEYLTLRDDPFMLFLLFIPALGAIAFWGLVYFAVFGFLLLLMSVVTFVWNYVVRKDMENKSWLGTLWIVIRLALAKIGLLSIWFAMAYIMNYMYSRLGGTTYPYTYIHSLAIIVYVILCTKYVFLKTFRQVKDSPNDMGASMMLQDAREGLGRLRNGRAFGGSESGGKEREKSVEKTLKNEGEEGEVPTGKVESVVGGIRNVMSKFKGKNYGEVDEISNALDPLGSKMEKRFPKLLKGVGGTARRNMLRDYDSIGNAEGVVGTSVAKLDKLAEAGAYGAVISSNANGTQIAKLGIGSTEHAERLVSHLGTQGIKAWSDDNGDVFFNSQGRDLDDSQVRKGMYNGLLTDYYNEIDNDYKVEDKEEENILPYTKTEDGNLSVDVNDKGISTSNIDNIINSKEFSDNFVLESKPEKDMKGEYIQGSMVVKARNGVDEEQAMEQLFERDARLREERGEQERGEVPQDRSVSYEGLGNMQGIQKYIKGGMSLQGDRITYDSQNAKHVKAISSLKERINTQAEEQYRGKLGFVTKLASHVAYGDNHGFETSYQNTSHSKEVKEFATQAGLIGEGVESKIYAGDNAERMSQKILEARDLTKMDQGVLEEYHDSKDKLHRAGDKLLLGEDEDYDKGLSKLMKLSGENGGDEAKVEQVRQQYAELGQKFNEADVTEKEYKQGVEGLYADLQMDMQDNGIYTKAITKEVSKGKAPKEVKEHFNGYVEAKRKLRERGVSTEMVERFDKNDLISLGNTLDNIEEVTANEDGTLNVQSTDVLDEGDVARIIDKMRSI